MSHLPRVAVRARAYTYSAHAFHSLPVTCQVRLIACSKSHKCDDKSVPAMICVSDKSTWNEGQHSMQVNGRNIRVIISNQRNAVSLGANSDREGTSL